VLFLPIEAESRGEAAEKLDTAYAGIGVRWQFQEVGL